MYGLVEKRGGIGSGHSYGLHTMEQKKHLLILAYLHIESTFFSQIHTTCSYFLFAAICGIWRILIHAHGLQYGGDNSG
jgi:hypothetical protein